MLACAICKAFKRPPNRGGSDPRGRRGRLDPAPLRAIRMTMLVASLRGAFDFCDAGVYRADGEFGLLFVD